MTDLTPPWRPDPPETMWCSECATHRSTPTRPLCPVCVDELLRKRREEAS